ncbi:MAG: hypothetical protein AAFP92_16515 [Bacteroidota bacterium]
MITQHLMEVDEILAEWIPRLDWPEAPTDPAVFHDLMSCIIEQQIHYRSTKKTFARLLGKAGIDVLTVENFEIFEEKALNGFKLSGKKQETIAGVIDFFSSTPPAWEHLTEQQIRAVFKGLAGIGPWTQDMMLLYTFGQADIFPVQDYHLRLIMRELYGLPEQGLNREMRQIAENWRPYRSYGVKYLFSWKAARKRQLI